MGGKYISGSPRSGGSLLPVSEEEQFHSKPVKNTKHNKEKAFIK
jgi:hypothetical protein